MQKTYSTLDLISLEVGVIGVVVTLQNTALTLLNTFGFVKGGILMVVTLLVVGVYGMVDHGENM